ncbi:hypothetical protein IW140_003198 [Coemansia sp. RSA 1813]|nr:hypothetical protein EV178_003118 [Coemansia sp. RSA 1646]KAJ1773956.1 hypothetical protein LPJ74_000055 [Coemansia sp. RSA 1843]KAJ2089324.1 hypothetical protein IW138_003490 [Coemansia sp. RSA 986]KAJ2214427.1 hypothetical protein EV179_002968 [Coemansia sp. RSA 487]KAJ2569351.1 hypothetical protein IW140_003198 [Coemansia sp. RSA 1813]
MDVTRENFKNALSEFKRAIEACDFVAIDMEMTGLYESKEQQPHRLDTKDERYAKLKRSVETYGVIQVGICMFTWTEPSEEQRQSESAERSEGEEEGGYYEARPFNFNVFPCTSVGRIPVETHFGCKNTAFEFLARNSFDFNKWVYSGIPYLHAEDAERIRAERVALFTNRQAMAVADDRSSRAFVKDFEKALRTFVGSGERTMRYETANGYQRKIIHDMVSRHDTLGTRGLDGNVEIFRATKKEMAKFTAKKLKLLDASVDEARGFCAVIDLLSKARKPVVGHNMPLDVLHAFSKFHRALPETRAAFEHAVAGFLPVLIDTKYIIESTPGIKVRYRTSNLDEIAPMLEQEAARESQQPLIRNHPRFTRHANQAMHEAGFDAYMTGATFIRLLKLEGGIDLSASIARSCEYGSELVLYRYINKLYMVLGDKMCWQIDGSDSRCSSAASPHTDANEGFEGAMEESDACEDTPSCLHDTILLPS